MQTPEKFCEEFPTPHHDAIATAAYQMWLMRGGNDDDEAQAKLDWRTAERQIWIDWVHALDAWLLANPTE